MKRVYRCPWCLELNEIFVDISAGDAQEYEEDCQVCCRPVTIRVRIEEDTLRVEVVAEAEG